MRLILAITSIHKLPIIKIDFLLAFTQSELDGDVFMELHLVMVVDGYRGEWVLNLNKLLYVIKQAIENWFDILKTVLEWRGYHQ